MSSRHSRVVLQNETAGFFDNVVAAIERISRESSGSRLTARDRERERKRETYLTKSSSAVCRTSHTVEITLNLTSFRTTVPRLPSSALFRNVAISSTTRTCSLTHSFLFFLSFFFFIAGNTREEFKTRSVVFASSRARRETKSERRGKCYDLLPLTRERQHVGPTCALSVPDISFIFMCGSKGSRSSAHSSNNGCIAIDELFIDIRIDISSSTLQINRELSRGTLSRARNFEV